MKGSVRRGDNLKIIKRNLCETEFDKSKIYTAIMKAMTNGSGIIRENIAQEIADEIEAQFTDTEKEISVSDIEKIVFEKLVEKGEIQTAKCYESYRSVREYQRSTENSTDYTIDELLEGMSEYWNKENSNKNAVLVTTQRDYMAGIVSEDMTKRYLLTPDLVSAHNEGIIHIHDMDYMYQKALHNCFSGDTEFLVKTSESEEGVLKPFNSFKENEEVVVMDYQGHWQKATVHCFGKQPLNEVVFKKCFDKNTTGYRRVLVTKNHKWLLSNMAFTEDLKVGDEIKMIESIAAIDKPWIVDSIESYDNGVPHDVYCVSQPVNHTFVVGIDLVTGNCDLVNLEDMLQNGTVISGTKIDKPHSFSTACNIATQIVAQVASSQLGLTKNL